MATVNMLGLLRNNAAIPGAFPGLKIQGGHIVNTDSSTHTVIIETKCTYVFSVDVHQSAAGTQIASVIAASTLYPGTKKVTFTIVGSGTNGGLVEYLIIGSNELDNLATIAADGTVIASEM
jgi:hypothetical protein